MDERDGAELMPDECDGESGDEADPAAVDDPDDFDGDLFDGYQPV